MGQQGDDTDFTANGWLYIAILIEAAYVIRWIAAIVCTILCQQEVRPFDSKRFEKECPRIHCTEDGTCAICMGELQDDAEGDKSHRRIWCGHVFHAECIDRWYTDPQKRCPLCRAPQPEPIPVAPRVHNRILSWCYESGIDEPAPVAADTASPAPPDLEAAAPRREESKESFSSSCHSSESSVSSDDSRDSIVSTAATRARSSSLLASALRFSWPSSRLSWLSSRHVVVERE